MTTNTKLSSQVKFCGTTDVRIINFSNDDRQIHLSNTFKCRIQMKLELIFTQTPCFRKSLYFSVSSSCFIFSCMKCPCRGLNEKWSHGPTCLNSWSPAGGALWRCPVAIGSRAFWTKSFTVSRLWRFRTSSCLLFVICFPGMSTMWSASFLLLPLCLSDLTPCFL